MRAQRVHGSGVVRRGRWRRAVGPEVRLRLAEQKCKTSTYCHRAQVIGGRLYVTDLRAIFFDR